MKNTNYHIVKVAVMVDVPSKNFAALFTQLLALFIATLLLSFDVAQTMGAGVQVIMGGVMVAVVLAPVRIIWKLQED